MTNIALAAVDVSPPTTLTTFVYAMGLTHVVEVVPAQIVDRFSTWMAYGGNGFIVFGTAPATLEASSALVVSTRTAPDVDAYKASIATSATAVTYSLTDLAGAVGQSAHAPTIVSVTASNHAHVLAGNIVFVGTQWHPNFANGAGPEIRVTVPITAGGNATFYGLTARDAQNQLTNPWLTKVTSIEVPAQGGTSGTFEFGHHVVTAQAAGNCLPLPEKVPVPFFCTRDFPFFAHEGDTASTKIIVSLSNGNGG